MKAAIEALPFERPKLAATMFIDGHDFAARLDRAIERSGVRPKRALPNDGLESRPIARPQCDGGVRIRREP